MNEIILDTETTGLNLVRDRLCLIQICTENKEIHLIKISKKNTINANLVLGSIFIFISSKKPIKDKLKHIKIYSYNIFEYKR